MEFSWNSQIFHLDNFKMMTISIIDLFAGPGGLGEGFSQVGWKEGNPFFRIMLSVEKDLAAHRTLKLRSFVRQFKYDEIPEEYFETLREGRNPEELYLIKKFTYQALKAGKEAWCNELRNDVEFNKELVHVSGTELKVVKTGC